MHRQTDVVPIRCPRRFAEVDPHPHADRKLLRPWVPGNRFLSGSTRKDGMWRRVEGEKGAVTFGVDLEATVASDRLAEEPAMRIEHLFVRNVAEAVQQLGRRLDVGEAQGDGTHG